MKECHLLTNEYYSLANILLLLSYIQTNMLILRLVFIAAYIFFLLFSLTLPEVSVDGILFSIFFCFVNAYLSVPLINAQIPPEFNQEEKEIFINHFRNHLTPKELEEFLKVGKRRVYRVNSCLFKTGHEFSSLFFIVKLGKSCKIRLKSTMIKNMNIAQYSWLGIPEYLSIISKKSLTKAINANDTGEWKVQANIFIDYEGNSRIDASRDEYSLDITNETVFIDNRVILYEFELKDLDRVFNNTINGRSILKGLQALWLKYCSSIIRTVDQKTLEEKDKREKRNAVSFEKRRVSVLGFDSPERGSLKDVKIHKYI
jgi:hypothetical protein